LREVPDGRPGSAGLTCVAMAQLVILLPAANGEFALSPASVTALSRLGVTELSMARDRETVALVLAGWAFDPTRPAAALSALGADAKARALEPVVQMAVSLATSEGGLKS
jgi:hypothetical protein